MRRSRTGLIAVAALAALTVAACSSSDKTASPTTNPATTVGEVTTTTTAETPTTPAATGPTTVAVAPTALGMILVDSKGMTLYIDENDQPGAPACTEACLGAWPPLKAPASPTFAAALDPSKFSTATAADGTKQLAVNEFPLYYFTNDKKPGDVTGQAAGGFYVVDKDGNKVEASAE